MELLRQRKLPAPRPVVIALAASLLAFAWQALTVHYNYGGNWTALFCTGAEFHSPPDALAFEHIYRFAGSRGYDGQMYHYIAHDPFLTRGFSASIDTPRFRYRRILVPLAAWLLAAGQDPFIDAAYFTVILICIFFAALWTANIASDRGANPAWAITTLLIPAVAVSIDRMTVDVALVALTAGVLFFIHRSRWAIVFTLCALAGLVRDSGVLLPAGIAVWALLNRRFRIAAAIAAASIPTFGWWAWLTPRTPPITDDLLSPIPFYGLLQRMVSPYPYPFGTAMNVFATVLDYAALAGIVVAVLYVVVYIRDLYRRPEGFIALAFVALVAFVSAPLAWSEAYAFARGYSPLILVVGLDGLRARLLSGALPLVLTAPRIVLEMTSQVIHVIRGLTGS